MKFASICLACDTEDCGDVCKNSQLNDICKMPQWRFCFLFKYIWFLYLSIQAILYAPYISSLDDHEQLQLLLVICFRTFFRTRTLNDFSELHLSVMGSLHKFCFISAETAVGSVPRLDWCPVRQVEGKNTFRNCGHPFLQNCQFNSRD